MLVAVSVYDGFSANSMPVITQPNTVPYKTISQGANFEQMQLQVVTSLDMWVAMHNALGAVLTNHEFNPEIEIAVFLLNCQLRSTSEAEGIVELAVAARKNTYQLILFSKAHFSTDGAIPEFVLNEQGKEN
jgi:hypothetical protein